MGPETAPAVVLLHGTGGACHSWRALAPALARRFRVVAPDLPGQGFTKLGAMQRSSLDLMAADLAALLHRLDVAPAAAIGHSAGGALALRLAEALPQAPRAAIGLNPALDDFGGAAGWLFPIMAKALAVNPFVAPTVSRLTTARGVERLIRATGSEIDAVGLACYRACLASTAHVDGTLTMMAQWRLEGLRRRLGRLALPVLFLTGDRDGAVPPEGAVRAAAEMPEASHRSLGPLGHLAHEEEPERAAAAICGFLDGVLDR